MKFQQGAQEQLAFVQMPLGTANVEEGDSAHIETRIAPLLSDKGLAIEWYKDGKLVSAGSRFNSQYDRGYISFDILYTFGEDTGEYSCVVHCGGFPSIQSAPFRIEVMADIANGYNNAADRDWEKQTQAPLMNTSFVREDRHAPKSAPKFLSDLPFAQAGLTAHEGVPIRFDLRLEPENDSSMVVQWLKDEKPVASGSRFNVVYDRGLALFAVDYCIVEDCGQYRCVARNALGEASTSTLTINIVAGDRIVTKSNLNEDSAGFKRIQEMENEIVNDADRFDFRYMEEQPVNSPPTFDILPIDVTVCEGGPARFLTKISGFPRPQVVWCINDQMINQNSLHQVYNDGAINVLEIQRCKDLGQNAVRVLASNNLGQIEATCNFNVVPYDDFRPDLKHITPENPYKKMVQLKRVEVLPELQKQLAKPKPTAEKINTIEAIGGHRMFKADVIETEKLYDSVASSLRRAP